MPSTVFFCVSVTTVWASAAQHHSPPGCADLSLRPSQVVRGLYIAYQTSSSVDIQSELGQARWGRQRRLCILTSRRLQHRRTHPEGSMSVRLPEWHRLRQVSLLSQRPQAV